MKKIKTTAKQSNDKKTTKAKSVTKAATTKTKTQTAQSAPKSGTKADYLSKHGIKIRPVTAKDRKYATTDYQKNANCIISIKGHKFFSTNGSLADCKTVVQLTKHQTGRKNDKK